MLRSFTILLGSIATCVLAFQIAVNAAYDIHSWETFDDPASQKLWFGLVAVGLLLGGSILMLHKPKHAAVAFGVSLPLIGVYELEFNQNYLSIAVAEPISMWLIFGAILLVVLALICPDKDPAPEVIPPESGTRFRA